MLTYPNTQIAKTAIIEDDVIIGENTRIADYVIIRSGTRIGANCQIFPYSVIGEMPQDRAYSGEKSFVEIGDNNILREFTTVHKASGESQKTIIGNNNYLMVSAHVGHNAKVGNGVTLANNVALGGYSEVQDYATIGGGSNVHQHCRVGAYSMFAGSSACNKDLAPYFMYAGVPAGAVGVNRYAFKKSNFSKEASSEIVKAYKIIFGSGLSPASIIAKLESELNQIPEIIDLIQFIKSSKRGIETKRFKDI